MDKIMFETEKEQDRSKRISALEPAPLLEKFCGLLNRASPPGPILDLACGRGHNGLFLAAKGFPVILLDQAEKSLGAARHLACQMDLNVKIIRKDLELSGTNPLADFSVAGVLVFRYLHRPLIPFIKAALKPGGTLIYETFTINQAKYGRPKNPNFLLKPLELKDWFSNWEIVHYFEGLKQNPPRAIAQIVCKKV